MAQATTHKTQYAARIKDGVKYYGEGHTKVKALDGVTTRFEKGKFTAIMGPSGSGKSTLMHCVAGLDNLSSGSVELGDTKLSEINDRQLTMLRRDKVGFIFQAFNLVPTLSAEENILLPLTIAGRKPNKAWYEKVISTVKLKGRLKHLPSELSGGQQQRVAAARALVSKPEIIFADEPSGNLDSKSGAQLLKFMRAVVDSLGQTIVMVTHDPNSAAYADRVVFLDDGKIVDDLTSPSVDQIFDKLKSLGS